VFPVVLPQRKGTPMPSSILGACTTKARGLPKDYVLAHVWLTRAAEQVFTEAVTLRESLEGLMIPEQLTKAQRLAREWKAKGE